MIGDPTAPVMGRGAAESRKSQRLAAAQASASSSRFHISPIVSPMFGITTWCSGWNAGTSNSFGRTSKPQVSVAIAAIATDTWGFEVRPNEFDVPAFQPLHQVVIPNMGLTIGEMWNLDELAEACAAAGRWDFLLSAAPLPITGAVGSPINPIALL